MICTIDFIGNKKSSRKARGERKGTKTEMHRSVSVFGGSAVFAPLRKICRLFPKMSDTCPNPHILRN